MGRTRYLAPVCDDVRRMQVLRSAWLVSAGLPGFGYPAQYADPRRHPDGLRNGGAAEDSPVVLLLHGEARPRSFLYRTVMAVLAARGCGRSRRT